MIEEIKNKLQPKGKTVIACLGQDLRGDGGVGSYIAKRISFENDDIIVINVGPVFEKYVNGIMYLKPNKLVVIDSAFFEGDPGEIREVEVDKLNSFKMIPSHTVPLSDLFSVIKDELRDLDIVIVGIQTKDIDLKEGLTEEVQKSADEIIDFYNSL
jgi:hydrogenase maturation protease HycI